MSWLQVSTVIGAVVPSEREQNAWSEGVAIWVAVVIVSGVGAFNDWNKGARRAAQALGLWSAWSGHLACGMGLEGVGSGLTNSSYCSGSFKRPSTFHLEQTSSSRS